VCVCMCMRARAPMCGVHTFTYVSMYVQCVFIHLYVGDHALTCYILSIIV